MITTYVQDYLYSTELHNIDNVKLTEHCLQIEKYLLDHVPSANLEWFGTKTGALHERYNIFTFAREELNELYHSIRDTVSRFLEPRTAYMLKGWLNVFYKGQFVNWHGHWPSKKGVWHGFYCVQTGEYISKTSYRIPDVPNVIDVPSVNGKLVFGKSEGDTHKSSEWNQDYPRITIAFDIAPVNSIENKTLGNHFIPFKI